MFIAISFIPSIPWLFLFFLFLSFHLCFSQRMFQDSSILVGSFFRKEPHWNGIINLNDILVSNLFTHESPYFFPPHVVRIL